MALNLPPEVETAVRQHAARAGISVDELLTRTFPPVEPNVRTLLQRWQQEFGLPPRPSGKGHTSIGEIVAQWNAEDEGMTSEEAELDLQIWHAYEKDHERLTI